MGLNIAIRTKYPAENCPSAKLSQNLFLLVNDFTMLQNSAFHQLSKILSIDLNAFMRRPLNLEPNIHSLEYELEVAKQENNHQKISLLIEKINLITQEWKENYKNNNEGWTSVDELRTLVENILEKIYDFPEYYKEINLEEWKNYFIPQQKRSIINRFYNSFSDDLHEMLDYIKCVESYGNNWFTFEYV